MEACEQDFPKRATLSHQIDFSKWQIDSCHAQPSFAYTNRVGKGGRYREKDFVFLGERVESLLLGTLLGDASISYPNVGSRWLRVVFNHSNENRGPVLLFNANASRNLFERIDRYIPECMSHKRESHLGRSRAEYLRSL